MSAEDYIALLDRRGELEAAVLELQKIRVDLGDARNEYKNKKSPITTDRMDQLKSDANKKLNDMDQKISPPELTEKSGLMDSGPIRSMMPNLKS